QRKSGSTALGLSCDEDGIFLAGDFALVMPITEATGRHVYRVRPLAEINIGLSAAYGRPVDFSDRMAGLRLAARYLTASEWALAKIAAVQLQMPDLPNAAAAVAQGGGAAAVQSEPLSRRVAEGRSICAERAECRDHQCRGFVGGRHHAAEIRQRQGRGAERVEAFLRDVQTSRRRVWRRHLPR